jgi:hypothetical protein
MNDQQTVTGDLVRGQICLYGGLLACILVRPEGLGTNNGISYYGTRWPTFAPYAFALLGVGFFTRRALRAIAPVLPGDRARPRLDLTLMADWFLAMVTGVALTPYTFGTLFDWAHTIISTLLFLYQVVLSVQLVRWTDGGTPSLLFLLLELVGGVIAARYVLPKDGYLLHGQVVFQIGFGGLVLRTATLLQPRSEMTNPDYS